MLVRRIAVIGTGYVGLTTGACLASPGHHVVCTDVDPDKIKRLNAGEVDILERGSTSWWPGGLTSKSVPTTPATPRPSPSPPCST
ncbi:MAG TPA: hypothetical protein VGX25_10710 [Actinophytocola sp.]|uniref:hypothetical protein n=1 Tax=Actinophytocola sp. TaxID=1872138 RepID=UPI002DDD2EA1|nr:hypothetical protein [Actinophytocola sp.]HEV2779857.1 hypothetical protein [Actinophytocola sp.]